MDSDVDRALLDLTGTLCDELLAPAAAAGERDGVFPRELLRKLGQTGLLGLPHPEQFGGGGVTTTTYLQVVERLAQAWLTVGLAVSVHTLVLPLAYAGTPEQQRRWLPDMIGGELFGAYCLSEPHCGSDAAASGRLRCATATRTCCRARRLDHPRGSGRLLRRDGPHLACPDSRCELLPGPRRC